MVVYATGTFNSASSATASAVVPAGAAAGHQAFFIVSSRSTSQVVAAPDATWIGVNKAREGTSSTGAAIYMVHKTLVTGDLGATISVSLAGSGPWCAVVVTASGLHATHPVLRSLSSVPLPAPSINTPTVVGATGSTTYEYVATSVGEAGESTVSAVMTRTNAPATLTATNYVRVRFLPVRSANTYNVYGRTPGGPYQFIASCDNTNLGAGSSDQRRGIDDTGQTPTATNPPSNHPQKVHWDARDADEPGRLTINFTNSEVLHVAALNAPSASPTLAFTSIPTNWTLLGQLRNSDNRILLAVYTESLAASGDLLSPGRLADFNAVVNRWSAISVILRPTGANGTPIAHAGIDYTGFSGSPVYLDGRLSSDLDEDDLSYSWTKLSGPAATLTGSTTATPSFTAPPGPATQVFRLTVTDPSSSSSTDDVTITSVGSGVPQFKSQTSTTAVSGTSGSLVLPNTGDGAAADDFAILVLESNTGNLTSGDPSGWTPLTDTPTAVTSSGGKLYVWTKTFVAGDLGDTVSWTFTASSRKAAACITTSTATLAASAKDETNTSGTSVVAPSVTPGTDSDLLVVIHGIVSNATGIQPTWTPDPATTERVDITSANGALNNATFLIATQELSSGAATGTRTATASANVQRQGISLALSAAELPPSTAGLCPIGAIAATLTQKSAQGLGSGAAGLIARSTVKRIVTVTGRCTTGTTSAAVVRKAAQPVGINSIAAVSVAASRKVVTSLGISSVSVNATAATAKLVPQFAVAPTGLITTVTARKTAPSASACPGVIVAISAATKVAAATGVTPAAALAAVERPAARATSGFCSIGFTARAMTARAVSAVAVCPAGGVGTSVASKVAVTRELSTAGPVTGAATSKQAPQSAAVVAGLSTHSVSTRRTGVTGSTVIGLFATGSPAKTIATVGTAAVGFTTWRSEIPIRAVFGRCRTGVFTSSPVGKAAAAAGVTDAALGTTARAQKLIAHHAVCCVATAPTGQVSKAADAVGIAGLALTGQASTSRATGQSGVCVVAVIATRTGTGILTGWPPIVTGPFHGPLLIG